MRKSVDLWWEHTEVTAGKGKVVSRREQHCRSEERRAHRLRERATALGVCRSVVSYGWVVKSKNFKKLKIKKIITIY